MAVDFDSLDEELGTAPKAKKSESFASFIKRGKEAREMIEASKSSGNGERGSGLIRFRITGDSLKKDVPVFFIDGDLDDEGYLDCAIWREHIVHQGKLTFPCISEQEACPACEEGDKPRMACGLTVLDMRPFTFTRGDREGETQNFTRKMFVFRAGTHEILQKEATDNGGLANALYYITRMQAGIKSPAVGEIFKIKQKYPREKLIKRFGEEFWKPIDFDKELNHLSRKELAKLGIAGTAAVGEVADKEDDGDNPDDIPF